MIRSIIIKVSAVVLSLALCALLLEVGLAVAHVNTRANSRFVSGVGAMHVPNAYYRNNKEGISEGYFNSHGFRDYERSYAKPSGTFRILVLGDSFVEALQVPLEKSFPALLEKKLNESHASTRFEVLNLGQSGIGTADEYNRYLKFGVKYDPDLVLVAFLTGNDFRNNSKFLNAEEVAPYYVFDEEGNLRLDSTVLDEYERSLTLPKRTLQFVKGKSYLANFISERVSLLSYQSRYDAFDRLASNPEPGKESQVKFDEFSDLNLYSPERSQRWEEAFAITRALLLKFRNSVEANGQRFALVTLSNAQQLDPKAQADLSAAAGIPLDFEKPDRIIEEFAAGEQISYLKLLPAFRGYRLRTGKNLHGFERQEVGHWNETGHWLAAEKIFEFLTTRHLVPTAEAK